jgi:hypothetical protein
MCRSYQIAMKESNSEPGNHGPTHGCCFYIPICSRPKQNAANLSVAMR